VDVSGALTNALQADVPSRVVLTPQGWRQAGGILFAGDGVNKTLITGESTKQPLKPSRAGMSGNSGGPVVTNSCVLFHFTREAVGALGARHSPRPWLGGTTFKTRT
jgi:hypothetical protein